MIPKIYDKDKNYIGELPYCTRGLVIEERNGMFELELDYRLNHQNYEYLVRGNIIEIDANDKQKNQLFRIYKVTKDILGQFSVYANHISYDIGRDLLLNDLDITNQSCEYCLNQLFRTSHFSQKFIGHSDIVNAQDYYMTEGTNLLLGIAGTSGSIIDTFGTGAEILRDNYDFYVLNKRGQDNGVVIEYASNLTGLDYEEDDTSLMTRIRAIAKYTEESTDGGDSKEIIVSTYVDSPLINEYETPFVGEVDFSDRFEEGSIPTVSMLQTLGGEYFNKTKCDRVKFSYKVSFIPLSKCVGYEGIEDQIDLCDTVTIIDERYGLNTQAKVIKATYDFLRDRYDSMELGEPRTSLGDVVGGNTEEPPAGPQGPKGEKGDPGETFPDILPTTPVLSCKLYGFASVELSWTFENRVFFTYELYASKTQGFTPNEFDLIHEGQSSSFLFQARPSETWYFRVCGKNSYGNRTSFSEEVAVTTTKVEDLSNYVGEMAIGEALIGELSLDRGWVGQLNASLLDVKGNFSVTDGNGKRTLDIDSFGNVYLDVTQLQINSSAVPNKDYVDESIASIKIDSEKIDFLVEKGSTSSNMKLTAEAIKLISDNIDLTGKVTFNSLGGGLKNQIDTTTELIDNWVYVDVETQTTLIDGGKIKTGSITADKIAAGAIAVDLLKSNNENPIIKLFSECALDATEKDGKGQGKAIRLKWDDYNYIYIGEDTTQFYQSGGGESSIFTITGDTSDTYLSNYGGKTVLMLGGDKEGYINDDLILTTKNAKEQLENDFATLEYTDKAIEEVNKYIDDSIESVNEYIDESIEDVNKTIEESIEDVNNYIDESIANLEELINNIEPGDGSGGGDHDHSEYATIEYVDELFNSIDPGTGGGDTGDGSSGGSDLEGWWDGTGSPSGSDQILGEYNLGGPILKSQAPSLDSDGWLSGFSKATKNPLFSVNGNMVINGRLHILGDWYCNGSQYSDKSLKENIRYITDSDTLIVEKENLNTKDYSKEELLVNDDLYDFIVNQVNLCEYNFIDKSYYKRQKIGFIANEYEGTKVGDKIVFRDDEIDLLGYDPNNLLFATIGALQEEVRIRDKQINELESRMELLENKLNELLNKGQD